MKNLYTSSYDNPAFDGDVVVATSNPSPPVDDLIHPMDSSETPTDDLELIEVPTLTTDTEVRPQTNGNVGVGSLPPSFSQASNSPSPPPPPAFDENAAVFVRNAYKSYKKGTPVLANFNMTVPRGTIYSLLGSSGCGKTTMLSCCVGIRKMDSGEILVFGHTPGTKESGVPGRRVGFMPQEISVYGELTIQEALNFFGRIYGMEKSQMEESTTFLIEFLDLPKATRRVGSLSGGQKRRVSIALALIHDPELLILDEPTVGVDPLLRESIWNHLVKLVTTGRTTVIITTHYVEEARQSNVIGMMRNGRLLTEKSPQALLEEFKMHHLEDIVLSLCRIDREERKKTSNKKENSNDKDVKVDMEEEERPKLEWSLKRKVGFGSQTTTVEEGGVVGVSYSSSSPTSGNSQDENGNGHANGDASAPPQLLMRRRKLSTRENIQKNDATTQTRLKALLIKNFIVLFRNIGFLLFIFIVPAIQVVLICWTIGSDPKGLLISVVNPEGCDFMGNNWTSVKESCPVESKHEENANGTLSCFYLAHLPPESFYLEYQPSETDAVKRIQDGYTYGYVLFPVDYTDNIICRFGGSCKHGSEAEANIVFDMDMSNKQIGQTMKRIFVDAYAEAMSQIKKTCHDKVSKRALDTAANVPYTFKQPVYGKDDTSFREFLAPSILLGLLFFFPLCSSGVSYITEKKTGTLDRALVAGVGTAEIMGGFLISQIGILLGQSGLAFIILTLGFQIDITGSISLALILTIFVGISGMSCGFLIAMFCTEEVHAVLIAIGTFFPNILLAGMVWPLEGMAKALQYVSYFLPCTLACESMRAIISRGWSLTHRGVWPGFLTTFAWIILYWTLSVLVHRYQRSRG